MNYAGTARRRGAITDSLTYRLQYNSGWLRPPRQVMMGCFESLDAGIIFPRKRGPLYHALSMIAILVSVLVSAVSVCGWGALLFHLLGSSDKPRGTNLAALGIAGMFLLTAGGGRPPV